MNKNPFFILSLFIFMPGITYAQQLTPDVVSTGGSFFSNNSGMLSFTVGESALTETYMSSGSILTQGFQQIWDLGTYIDEQPDKNFSFNIYPNPSDGNFYLLTRMEFQGQIEVNIFDVLGREMLHHAGYQQNKIEIQPYELSYVSPGSYWMSITAIDKVTNGFIRHIKKIQIVK